MAKNTLGLVFFPAFDWMISPGHPERQERLLYTRDQLEEEGLFDCEEIREYRPRLAEINDLQRVHVGVPAISRVIMGSLNVICSSTVPGTGVNFCSTQPMHLRLSLSAMSATSTPPILTEPSFGL